MLWETRSSRQWIEWDSECSKVGWHVPEQRDARGLAKSLLNLPFTGEHRINKKSLLRVDRRRLIQNDSVTIGLGWQSNHLSTCRSRRHVRHPCDRDHPSAFQRLEHRW